MKLMSYTFVAMAGLCFISGLYILSNEGDIDYGEIRDAIGYI